MIRWGQTLSSLDSGLDWMVQDHGEFLERCAGCNTYADDLVLHHTPRRGVLEEFSEALARHPLLVTREGLKVFSERFSSDLERSGVSPSTIREAGSGVYTFDLAGMPLASPARADYRKASECTVCGRVRGVWRTERDDDVIVLDDNPIAGLVRSIEFFGVGPSRRPDIFVSDPLCTALRLVRSTSWQVSVA